METLVWVFFPRQRADEGPFSLETFCSNFAPGARSVIFAHPCWTVAYGLDVCLQVCLCHTRSRLVWVHKLAGFVLRQIQGCWVGLKSAY